MPINEGKLISNDASQLFMSLHFSLSFTCRVYISIESAKNKKKNKKYVFIGY